ncbi:discoidin domain-containing protein (plasmid) [Paenibacillus urinalis]|uniref:Discoidin domain-containing protein n=1 Tax=Paenibacillus urinalis TaxID=521520 RepID=A0ABY7XGY3_9BACL|nr:discoidin domain-containing protein [Paenibacillus urinalis]WDI05092.1 discoidin domain-containing protein [Paenibacillus urinalis]
MGIRQTQLSRTVEKIVRSYLQRGRYPSIQTITYHLGQWLREHTPGAPSFSPRKVLRKEKSDSESYNDNVTMIRQDIGDLYDATISQTIRIMNDFNFVETERAKISHELSMLSKKIDQLLLVSGAGSSYLDTVIEDFIDTSRMNTGNSTAAIDLNNGQITLKENQRQSNKVLLSGSQATFNALTPNVKQSAIETINNAFDDNINTAWWHVIKTTGPGTVKAELTIRLASVEEINEVEYIAHHGKPVLIQVEYSLDGSTFTPLPEKNNKQSVSNRAVWNFSQLKVKAIKFTYEKKDHDDNSAGMYNYYFGAKSISISKKSYLSEGTLITQPFVFSSDNINMVSLNASQDIPFGTAIDYEVALTNETTALDSLIWYPISPSEDTTPKYSKTVEFNARASKNIEFGQAEATQEVKNGMRVFRLLKDDKDGTLPESFDDIQNPILLRGINQWRRERSYIKFDGTIPLNSTWKSQYDNRPDSIRTNYQAIGNQLNLRRENGGKSDNFYRFTTCVYSEEARVEPLSLAVIQTVSGVRKRIGTYAVYVDGKRMVPSNEEVTLTLAAGWSEIQILFHWGDMQLRQDFTDGNLPNETLLGKFNFLLEKRVRADKDSLKIVDEHSLYYNISPNNRDYFAIYENQVVLNYLPSNCIFQLVYEVIDSSIQNNQVVVRASMRREESIPHITPKIMRLQLQAK